MKLVKKYGNLPPPMQVHEITCRECGSEYTSITKDADKIYSNPGYWRLLYNCPCCKNKNVISIYKPDKAWPADINRNVVVKPKEYGGTF